ncbi:MAG: DUF3168 domain-containing protein [Alphaproteobacteria bacterium]|nr:DUF3168 domain-containing protein [Alphaproteobacteria bacterium]
MTYFSQFSLQQSLYQQLTGDTTLMALVSGIFDHVPQGTAYPFVTIGEAAIRDFSNAEKQGTEQQVTLRIYSREAGRKQASAIMERIVTLLNSADLTVSGQTLRSLRFLSSNIVLQDDGLTYRGTLIFRALLNEA